MGIFLKEKKKKKILLCLKMFKEKSNNMYKEMQTKTHSTTSLIRTVVWKILVRVLQISEVICSHVLVDKRVSVF